MIDLHFGELFPRVGFIVTNLTAEQWIKEGKQAVKMTRLSCHRFRANEVRLWLSVIAYNLGNLWRRLVSCERNVRKIRISAMSAECFSR
jgi:hypothetical protein